MGNTDRSFSRRTFLKGTVAGTLSLASMGVLSDSLPLVASAEETSPAETAPANTATPFKGLNPQDYNYRQNSGDLSSIFSEWKLGPLTLHHRMVKSAAGSEVFEHGIPEEAIEYYANFARGGVEMVWVENFGSSFFGADLSTFPIKEVLDAIHAEGAYAGYQFDTMGTKFSPIPYPSEPFYGSFTQDEVHELQQEIIDMAKTMHDYGFDAFEINVAGDNAGQSFLSRMRNNRTDEYGPQSFENRTRFVCEIIRAIKEQCGKDFIVQVLFNGIEENDTNIGQNSQCTTVEEAKEFAKYFEAAGADSLHVRLGPLGMHVCQFASDLYFTGIGIEGTTAFGTQFDFSKHWQGKLIANHSGCGMMLDVAKEIKEAVSIPVGTVTYMDPAHAPDYFNNAIKEGKADFLIMNRPLTVDPDYVNKLRDGRIDEIAPCTRCMHCHRMFAEDGSWLPRRCRVNACTHRAYQESMPEGYTPLPGDGEKKVMVIGGGPAGMEAARIAAQRGYKVSLYEKKGTLGGLLTIASAVKGPHENLNDLINYLKRQLEITGVDVITGQEVDAAFIESENPDVVILASGGKRDTLGLTETDKTKVYTVDNFATAQLGEHITLVGGNAQSVDIALYLLEKGKHVTIVMSEGLENLEKGHSDWVKSFITPMLYARGVRVWPNASIASVGNGSVTVHGETGVDITFDCDSIIEAMDMLPNNDLIQGLSMTCVAVGDCETPYNILEAISSANLAARKI